MKKDNSSYIDDIIEMQEKQFLPGYYTGGRVHPSRRRTPHKPKLLAILYFISAISTGATSAFFITSSSRGLISILSALFAGSISILSIIAGIKYWKMKPPAVN